MKRQNRIIRKKNPISFYFTDVFIMKYIRHIYVYENAVFCSSKMLFDPCSSNDIDRCLIIATQLFHISLYIKQHD